MLLRSRQRCTAAPLPLIAALIAVLCGSSNALAAASGTQLQMARCDLDKLHSEMELLTQRQDDGTVAVTLQRYRIVNPHPDARDRAVIVSSIRPEDGFWYEQTANSDYLLQDAHWHPIALTVKATTPAPRYALELQVIHDMGGEPDNDRICRVEVSGLGSATSRR